MNLENAFKNTLNSFKISIEKVLQKNFSIAKILRFNQPDPHIEKMIHSFALICASFQVEAEKKINRAITSVLCNLSDSFLLHPQTGLLQFIPKETKFIDKGFNINCGESVFKVKYQTYIHNIEIEKQYQISMDNQEYICLELYSPNPEKIKEISFYTNEDVISGIFSQSNQIVCFYEKEECIRHNCNASWNIEFKLTEFVFTPFLYTSFKIQNLNFQKNQRFFKIYLPLKAKINNQLINITTNVVAVENLFYGHTYSLRPKKPGEYFLSVNSNIQIRRIIKVMEVESKNELSGWYSILSGDEISIYLKDIVENDIICEVELVNKKIELENFSFETSINSTCLWLKTPSEKEIIDNSLFHLIKQFPVNINPRKLLKHYQKILYSLGVNIEIDNILEKNYVSKRKYGSFVLPILGKNFNFQSDSNFLILKGLLELMKKNSSYEISFDIKSKDNNYILK